MRLSKSVKDLSMRLSRRDYVSSMKLNRRDSELRLSKKPSDLDSNKRSSRDKRLRGSASSKRNMRDCRKLRG